MKRGVVSCCVMKDRIFPSERLTGNDYGFGRSPREGFGESSPTSQPQGFLAHRVREAVDGTEIRFSVVCVPMLAGN